MNICGHRGESLALVRRQLLAVRIGRKQSTRVVKQSRYQQVLDHQGQLSCPKKSRFRKCVIAKIRKIIRKRPKHILICSQHLSNRTTSTNTHDACSTQFENGADQSSKR